MATGYAGGAVATRQAVQRRGGQTSIVKQPAVEGASGRSKYLFMDMAAYADGAPAWGKPSRDKWLREFYKTEHVLAGAVAGTAAKYAGFDYTLDGPQKSKAAVQNVLRMSEHGKGWKRLWLPTVTDYLTQDNGAFVEVVRTANSYTAPVVGLNHLDAAKCVRTGRWDTPVVYTDNANKDHLLQWYQVMDFVDNPAPEEETRGMQVCGISRILRAAQIMRDIAIYKHEKVSGQFNRRVNIINGVGSDEVYDAIGEQREQARAQGLTRYILPIILAAMDHRANLSMISIDLAELPENFDEDTANRWYCMFVALCLGQDPQEIVPLQSHGLGTSSEAEMLHMKGRGKGPALFIGQVEEQFVNQGIVPANCEFKFNGQDSLIDKDKAQLRLLRAQERAVRIKSGELTPQVARQIAVDEGDLDEEYLEALDESDLTMMVSGPEGIGQPVGGPARGRQISPTGGRDPGASNGGLTRKDVRASSTSGQPNMSTSRARVR